jgi:hypothetical protein
MSDLPKGMEGKPLTIDGREVEFSLWPTKGSAQSCELNYRVYVSDPWPFLRDYVGRKFTEKKDEERKNDAGHFLRQAEGYYLAATSTSIREARPVLIYYSFQNLVKSALLCGGTTVNPGSLSHGLSVKSNKLVAHASGIIPTGGYRVSVFDELLDLLGVSRLSSEYTLSHLVSQVLMGHRMRPAADGTSDRFVRVKGILPMQGIDKQKIWLRLKLESANLQSYKPFCEELLSRTQLINEWHEVLCDDDKFITLEQREAEPYSIRPIEKLEKLASILRPRLWQAAVITQPYRKYYLYAASIDEYDKLLPQLASIYALMFYLSFLTRYYPSEYRKLLSEKKGFAPFIEGFLQDSPKQFLYLFASEMMQREVSSGDHI